MPSTPASTPRISPLVFGSVGKDDNYPGVPRTILVLALKVLHLGTTCDVFLSVLYQISLMPAASLHL